MIRHIKPAIFMHFLPDIAIGIVMTNVSLMGGSSTLLIIMGRMIMRQVVMDGIKSMGMRGTIDDAVRMLSGGATTGG